jgi:O-antigen ligase
MSLSNAAGCGAFLLAWLWFDDYRPWFKSHSEAWAGFAVMCWWGAAIWSKPRQTHVPLPALVALLPVVLAALQWAAGLLPFAGDVLLATVYFGGLAAAMGLAWGWQQQGGGLARPVTGVVLAAALGNVAIGWLQWLQLQEPFGMFLMQGDVLGDTARGNLGQSNHLATLAVLGVLAGLAAFEARAIGMTGLIAVGLFLGSGIVLSNSRTGLLNVLLVSALLLGLHKRAGLRVPVRAIIAWPLACWAMAAALPTVSGALLIRQIDLARTQSVGDRWLMWKQCWDAILLRPWTGYGFEHMSAAQAAGAAAPYRLKELTFTHAHSLPLDLAVWFGVPAALVILATLAWWAWSRMRTVASVGSLLALAGLMAIGVHSMLEFPFAYLYFLIAAGLMAGWIEAGHQASASNVTPRLSTTLSAFAAPWPMPRWLAAMLWVGALVLGAAIVRDYALAEEDFRVVRFENSRVGETPVEYQAPQLWVLDQLGTMLTAARTKAVPGMSAKDLESLRQASERFAYGSLRFRFVRALALNGHLGEARRQMGVIRAVHGDFYHRACLDQLQEMVQGGQPGLAPLLASPAVGS